MAKRQGTDEEALKALIRATILSAGPLEPGQIPHRVKERIKGRATGDLDVEAYIREVMAERAGKRRGALRPGK